MFNYNIRKEFISNLKRNFNFDPFSYQFSTTNNSKFKTSPKSRNNSSRLEEFTYKIDEFVPSNSKYSISDKTQPEHNETSPAVRVPKYIENNDYYNKFLKSNTPDENSSRSKTNGIIPVKFLKPGRKSKLPIKSFQKKLNKEDRLQHRKELEKREERKKVSYDERKLLENQDTAVSRNDLKYVSDEKKRLKEFVSKIREEKSIERKKFFNTENLNDFDKEERLSKRLARLGVSSRRQAERMIKTGMVKIEGKEVSQNIIVNDESNIQIYSKNGFKTPIPESTRIWLFYKPIGLICTPNDEKKRFDIYQFLARKGFEQKHYYTIGKLDINSEGLIVLTNNPDIAVALDNNDSIERAYRVRVYGRMFTEEKINKIRQGIKINMRTIKFHIEIISKHNANSWVNIKTYNNSLVDIRNVFRKLSLRVNRMIRIRYGPFTMGVLRSPGDITESVIPKEINRHLYFRYREKLQTKIRKLDDTRLEAIKLKLLNEQKSKDKLITREENQVVKI